MHSVWSLRSLPRCKDRPGRAERTTRRLPGRTSRHAALSAFLSIFENPLILFFQGRPTPQSTPRGRHGSTPASSQPQVSHPHLRVTHCSPLAEAARGSECPQHEYKKRCMPFPTTSATHLQQPGSEQIAFHPRCLLHYVNG